MGASREEIAAEAMKANADCQRAKNQLAELKELPQVNTILLRGEQSCLWFPTGTQPDPHVPAEAMGFIQIPHFHPCQRTIYIPHE